MTVGAEVSDEACRSGATTMRTVNFIEFDEGLFYSCAHGRRGVPDLHGRRRRGKASRGTADSWSHLADQSPNVLERFVLLCLCLGRIEYGGKTTHQGGKLCFIYLDHLLRLKSLELSLKVLDRRHYRGRGLECIG